MRSRAKSSKKACLHARRSPYTVIGPPEPRMTFFTYFLPFHFETMWRGFRRRGLVTPARRKKVVKFIHSAEFRTPAERHAAMTWAHRLKRGFNIDSEVCVRCGGSARKARKTAWHELLRALV